MKVSELEGAELDYWVAKAGGHPIDLDGIPKCFIRGSNIAQYWPSRDWEIAGPIIEREGISIIRWGGDWFGAIDAKQDSISGWVADTIGVDETRPLVAAMRCYVASKFGEEVPEEKEAA